ncbi:MAG: DnaJ domain-containing protein [Acidobacteria bacterium]|nr:DnaJ domain-containing protein [Acidobacteriota bacterium]
MAYCVSFGTLIASMIGGVFAPFCRKRAPELRLVPDSPRRAPSGGSGKQDRIAEAMRNWRTARAQADLACVPLRRPAGLETVVEPEPAPRATPQVEPVNAEPQVKTVDAGPAAVPDPPAAAHCEEAPTPEPRESRVQMEEQADSASSQSRTVEEPNPFLRGEMKDAPNFYEILQISPRADLDTIHRVYRIMAARFHPDNPVSGDHERFLQLCEAYEVLSQPGRRAQYDCVLRAKEAQPMPIFEMRVFVDGLEGEVNRRFGILALLYQRRRINPASPGVSTLELERRMSLPREHLEFTLWYLRSKMYLQIMEDNSDYAITSAGVDYVETNLPKNPIVRELLKSAHPSVRHAPAAKPRGRNRDNRRREERTEAIILAS